MYKTTSALIVGCVAALAFAAPKPALATTAVPIQDGASDAGLVQEVGKKDKNWTKRDRYTYRDGPRYRPYYSDRRYSYDYERDYDYDYPRRRSGTTLHFDF
jgi:hypothetical protein